MGRRVYCVFLPGSVGCHFLHSFKSFLRTKLHYVHIVPSWKNHDGNLHFPNRNYNFQTGIIAELITPYYTTQNINATNIYSNNIMLLDNGMLMVPERVKMERSQRYVQTTSMGYIGVSSL